MCPKVVVTVQFKKDEKCETSFNKLVEAINGDNPLKIVFDGVDIKIHHVKLLLLSILEIFSVTRVNTKKISINKHK